MISYLFELRDFCAILNRFLWRVHTAFIRMKLKEEV